MGPRLNENAQEALQFLVLGSGIILGGRLVHLAVVRMMDTAGEDPLVASARSFQQGYLLPDPGTFVVSGMDLGGRIALALVFALLGGLFMALLGLALAKFAHREKLPWVVGFGRIGLLLCTIWGLFAALALPPAKMMVVPSGMVVTERHAFMGELSLPLPAATFELAWDHITSIEARTSAQHTSGCGSMEEVVVYMDGAARSIAGLVPQGSDCNEAVYFARAHTQQLVDLLVALRSSGRTDRTVAPAAN